MGRIALRICRGCGPPQARVLAGRWARASGDPNPSLVPPACSHSHLSWPPRPGDDPIPFPNPWAGVSSRRSALPRTGGPWSRALSYPKSQIEFRLTLSLPCLQQRKRGERAPQIPRALPSIPSGIFSSNPDHGREALGNLGRRYRAVRGG